MNLTDPHLWWYLTRVSAMLAWALMTLSVVWGVLLSTRLLRRVDNPAWLQDLHRYLGGLAVVMVLVHMVTLMLDGWLHLSPAELLIPMASDYRPFAVALGILAFYLLVAVQVTSMVMHRLPRRFWKGLHFSIYGVVILVAFHAGLAGTDAGSLGYVILASSIIGLTVLATIARLIVSGRTRAAATAEVWVPPRDTAPRSSPPRRETSTMVVVETSLIAESVRSLRLAPLGGGLLPIWYPGSHITLHLPNGLERQYSLCGDPGDRHAYELAVLHTADSAGGSRWIHEHAAPGVTIEVSSPINRFELEPAREYLFIAGGIGITPIKSMIESLPPQRAWRLLYLGRSRRTMAFANELETRSPRQVRILASDEMPERIDIASLVTSETTEVYCCGPESLLAAVAAVVPESRLHLERFEPVDRVATTANQSIELGFSRSPLSLTVGPDESVLDVLERNGLPVLGSCRSGVCGACEVRVVAGTPEHLDSVMADREKDRLRVMYPCVSRSRTETLVLDF